MSKDGSGNSFKTPFWQTRPSLYPNLSPSDDGWQQKFFLRLYISDKTPCFLLFTWRFHKIPIGWANTSMINKFVCQNWLYKEYFFYFVIFLLLLLSLHFPHVSRKVLCTSVTWSFLCSCRIWLMYWGIKCPWVWQFHFLFSLSKSLATYGFCSITLPFYQLSFSSSTTLEASTPKRFWTPSSDDSQWEFDFGNTLVFWFWRKQPILTHDLRSCISAAYHGIFFLVIKNGRFLNMFIHFIYRPQMIYIFIFISAKSHIGSFADGRNFFLR